MSSKRAKRKKRQENFKTDSPNKPVVKAAPEPLKKLPGQWWVRTGSALMLIGGLLTALLVWFALREINKMNADELVALTGAAGQSPWLYMVNLIFVSIAGVLQFSIGYYTFKNAKNPFLAKKMIVLSSVLIAFELFINIFTMLNSTTGFQLINLFYGCTNAAIVIFGAYRNMVFAKNHPDYVPPEPTQMF